MMRACRYSLTALIIAGLTAVCFSACGRKAPPVPPGIPPLQAAKGLTHTLEGAMVTLTWKPISGKAAENLAGYTVMRSVTGPGDDLCEGCPILFKRARELGATTTEYREQVSPGSSYIYKVIGHTTYKETSPDSNLVRFTVPVDDKGDG